MPDWLLIALAVFAGLLVLLAIGGAIANARRRRRTAGAFETSLEEVNQHLAAAHAQDKGWEPESLYAEARRIFEEGRPGEAVRDQALVQVLDRPGTDEDKAVFRFVTETGEERLTLGRRAGVWQPDVGL